MKLLIEKRNYILLILIIILIFWIFSIKKNQPFIKSFDLNDKEITIIIYEKIDEDKIIKEIKSICTKYEDKTISYKKDNELSEINKEINFSNSYAVLDIIKYFKIIGINKYSINENGNISVGKRYRDKKYIGGILKKSNYTLLKTLNLENESMITVGEDDLVTVICKDNVDGYALANYLYNIDFQKVKEENNFRCLVYYNKDGNVYESKELKNK